MPIYEYECTSCHHLFDLMQKVGDAPVKQCPQCYENTAIRLISAAGFQLKGSGWYATDFKDKGKPTENKGEDKSTKDNVSKEKSPPASTSKGESD